MAYHDSQDEQRKFDNIEQWTQNVFRPLGIPAPAYIEGEQFDQQRKRIMEKARPFVSDELQQIKKDDVFGTASITSKRNIWNQQRRRQKDPPKYQKVNLKRSSASINLGVSLTSSLVNLLCGCRSLLQIGGVW